MFTINCQQETAYQATKLERCPDLAVFPVLPVNV
jgi:hypothetical protein